MGIFSLRWLVDSYVAEHHQYSTAIQESIAPYRTHHQGSKGGFLLSLAKDVSGARCDRRALRTFTFHGTKMLVQ
jgi:hypothetical protein